MKVMLTIALAFSIVLGSSSAAAEQKHSTLQEANSLSARGQYQAAVGLYERAAAEQPGNPMVYHMWGRTLALMSNLSAACQQYRKAVELAPKNAELINDLGVALSASGFLDEAVAQFRRVNAISPQFVQAYNNLGVTLMRKGKYNDAVESFKFSLKLQPKNTAIQSKLKEATKYAGQENATNSDRSDNDSGAGNAKLETSKAESAK
jgi:Flp pilus assembly protein TadD